MLRRPFRAWIFAAVGGAWVVQSSFSSSDLRASPGGNVIPSAQGGILELPFGVGFSWATGQAVSPRLIAELEGRAALLEGGALYDAAPCSLCSRPFDGKESFAVGLSVGVSWGP